MVDTRFSRAQRQLAHDMLPMLPRRRRTAARAVVLRDPDARCAEAECAVDPALFAPGESSGPSRKRRCNSKAPTGASTGAASPNPVLATQATIEWMLKSDRTDAGARRNAAVDAFAEFCAALERDVRTVCRGKVNKQFVLSLPTGTPGSVDYNDGGLTGVKHATAVAAVYGGNRPKNRPLLAFVSVNASTTPAGAQDLYMDVLCAVPGTTLAHQLMMAVKAHARDIGAKRIRLRSVLGAVAFYKRAGFHVDACSTSLRRRVSECITSVQRHEIVADGVHMTLHV